MTTELLNKNGQTIGIINSDTAEIGDEMWLTDTPEVTTLEWRNRFIGGISKTYLHDNEEFTEDNLKGNLLDIVRARRVRNP